MICGYAYFKKPLYIYIYIYLSISYIYIYVYIYISYTHTHDLSIQPAIKFAVSPRYRAWRRRGGPGGQRRCRGSLHHGATASWVSNGRAKPRDFMGKPWENGDFMGKTRENHEKVVKNGENHRKTIGKP